MRRRTVLAGVAFAGAAEAREGRLPTGDIKRSYRLESANETMPYRLYVPKLADPTGLPMVVVLHGGGGDPDTVFSGTGLAELAEARKVIVVAPMGYSRFGGYGLIYPAMMRHALGAAIAELRARSTGAGAADRPGAPERPKDPAPPDDIQEVSASAMVDPEANARSLEDVMNVIRMVRDEYRVDPRRIYMLGNSMGGMGTMNVAAKFPEVFAAIAPAGGPVAAWSYPFGRLRQHGVAALFIHGELDEHANPIWSRKLYEAARAEGVDARFLEVKGKTHTQAWIAALPQTFDFLLAHKRRTAR